MPKNCLICDTENDDSARFCRHCGAPFKEKVGKYDAFISYRREDGAELAQVIKTKIEDLAKNKKIFLDVEELGRGQFDEELLKHIENSDNFIIILTARSLERCMTDGDWVRREIALAIKLRKNIIPVYKEGFDFYNLKLPDDIRNLTSYNAVKYDSLDVRNSILKLLSFFQSSAAQKERAADNVLPQAETHKKSAAELPPLATEFNKDEQKYINKLRQVLEDRQISDIERNSLVNAARLLQIAPDRAKELEEQVKRELGMPEQALVLQKEQTYLNELRQIYEDKQRPDIEIEIAEAAELLDIPPPRAKELEEQVRKELGIVELTLVQEGTTAEIIAEEGSLRDIAEHFVDDLNKKYESHLKAIDSKFELDPNGLKIMLDYSVGYSCKFVFEFQNEFMNCSLWDWCCNEPPISGSKDFFGEWFNNECEKDFPNYEWNKRRLYGYLVFWQEEFSSEASEPQLFIDFKKRTSSTLDLLLPKLEKLYNESAGIIGALAKLRDLIDNTVASLKQAFPQEEGWIVEQNAKSLSQWSGISIYKSAWEGKVNFRMESWNGHFDKLFFGLKRGEWEYTFQSLSDDELNNKLNGWFGEGTKDGWFFYWNWFDEKYRYTGGLEFSLSQERQNEFITHYVEVFKKMKELTPFIDDALKDAESVALPASNEEPSSDVELREFANKFQKLKDGFQQLHSDYLETNKTEAADFNIFHLLGVAHYEVSTHSAMLRELLDSNASHGQGNLFFIEFLSMLADKKIIHKDDIHKYSPKTFDDYVCEAERSVATGRIDIIIERLHGDFPFCIIIENKVYAVDQYEQIERYWAELEKKAHIPESRKEIIYLTPKGCLPSEDSIDCQTRKELESKGALHYLSYNQDIRQWLEGVLSKVESPKVEGMLRHYIEIVKDL